MSFRTFEPEKEKWISFVDSKFYPDTLVDAKREFIPIIDRFGELLCKSKSSAELLLKILDEPSSIRTQFLRIFRRYVSPDTSVEMLKRKTKAQKNIEEFGDRFRPIDTVRKYFFSRPKPDDALIALLIEYSERGQKGYDLTETFFNWFEGKFAGKYSIAGAKRGSSDIDITTIFHDFPKSIPLDFVIYDRNMIPIALGFARYDTDRGGAQEDDRTGGYRNVISDILQYSREHGRKIKIIFVNDGPGLVLGSMWDDYSYLEEIGEGNTIVVTLKMLDERLTEEWILT